MANKKPWKVGPGMGGRQAYVHVDESGTTWIRQSLRTEDGRVLWFDMTPGEAMSLVHDLDTAHRDLTMDFAGNGEYPEARF